MKLSEFIDALKELPPDTTIEGIDTGKDLSLGKDALLVIQLQSGALAPRERNRLTDFFSEKGVFFVLIEHAPGRGPIQFGVIRK